MHPILAELRRVAAYVAAWLAVGLLLSTTLTRQGLGWLPAIVFLLPPLVVYAFICLSAWYVCRAVPLATTGIPGVLATSGAAAAMAGVLWVLLSQGWLSIVASSTLFSDSVDAFQQQTPLLFSASVMLFLLVMSVHYVVLAFEAVRDAERQQLELKVLTRDAEIRALRAQIDPHFLYNSLNSISALTAIDPPGARRMCLLLGEFMRNTLKVSARDHIPIAEELALVDGFFSIEQVRFGDRLRVVRDIEESATACRIPPLLLQPLVENAIAHGIAGLIEGGTVRLAIAERDGRVSIVVENPRDPELTPRKRGGVGLDNVRRRLAMMFPDASRLTARATEHQFRVEIDMPCLRELPAAAAQRDEAATTGSSVM